MFDNPRPFLLSRYVFVVNAIKLYTKKAMVILVAVLPFCTTVYSQTQTHLQVVNDSVRVTNGELVLRNTTSNVNGYLYNSGNGITVFTDAKTSKANLGIEAMRLITSWANTPATSTDKFLLNNVAGGSSPVTYTLPAASSVNAGAIITVGDAFGSPGAGIQIVPSGSDHLNGATAATAPFTTAFFQLHLVSDGTGNWYYNVPSQGVTSVPANATQAGIVSLGNQTLGTGWKTMQEISTQTNINLPSTATSGVAAPPDGNGYIGAIAMNNSPLIWVPNGDNYFFGLGTGVWNVSGHRNIAIGPNTFASISTGSNNIAMGFNALNAEDVGSGNVAIGASAAWRAEGGSNNVYIGTGAGGNSSPPSYALASENIMIGYNAGSHITVNGSNNVLIGVNALQSPPSTPINKFYISGGSNYNGLLWGDFNNGQLMVGGLSSSTPPTLTAGVALEVASGAFKMATNPNVGTPVEGMQVYDGNKHRPIFYNGTAWTANTMTHSFIVSTSSVNSTLLPNSFYILNPAGPLSSLTIELRSGSYASNDDVVEFTVTQNITNVTYFVNGGGNNGQCPYCPTTLVPGVRYKLTYDAASWNWY